MIAVLPIGGADMPVVISTLNAFTGLSAAAAGVALDNTALIVAGMLVGASGSILTRQMAEAMNRSIGNVFFSGLGAGGPALAAETGGTVRSTSAADVAIQLSYARLVVVVPGYGMAVAQAQRAVADLAAELERRGVEVLYAIHPVAGRMPGHMNVLLAEADVPYEQLKEMDDINGEFGRTDVALVIGANDVTNPAARTVADSPIYGMPILDVDKASSIIVLKRSMSSGFAGVDNPLFYDEKTSMLFGDAKTSVGDVLTEVKSCSCSESGGDHRRDDHGHQERRAAPHADRRRAESRYARVDDHTLAVAERLHDDQRRQQRHREQREDARHLRRRLAVAEQQRPGRLERVAPEPERQQRRPAHERLQTPASTPRLAAITGTPGGVHGISTSAITAPAIAAATAPSCLSCGASSARNAAGNIASSPYFAGSPSPEPASAPASVPAFQHTNTAAPVSQKAPRAASSSSCARAIAVVSSITSCAVTARRASGPRSSEASDSP